MYRGNIRKKLEELQNKDSFEMLLIGCAVEDDITEEEAEEKVYNLLQATKRFLTDDYDRIMKDIKHKINTVPMSMFSFIVDVPSTCPIFRYLYHPWRATSGLLS